MRFQLHGISSFLWRTLILLSIGRDVLCNQKHSVTVSSFQTPIKSMAKDSGEFIGSQSQDGPWDRFDTS